MHSCRCVGLGLLAKDYKRGYGPFCFYNHCVLYMTYVSCRFYYYFTGAANFVMQINMLLHIITFVLFIKRQQAGVARLAQKYLMPI